MSNKKQNRKVQIAWQTNALRKAESHLEWHDNWLISRGIIPDYSHLKPFLEQHIPAHPKFAEIARELGIIFWRPGL